MSNPKLKYVADPDPGPGIKCFLKPGIRIRGPGWKRNPDPGSKIRKRNPDPGSEIRRKISPHHVSESYVGTLFGLKITVLKFCVNSLLRIQIRDPVPLYR
jgi:hypothetical protein